MAGRARSRRGVVLRVDRDVLAHAPTASLSNAAWRCWMLLWARSNGATRVAAPGDPATLAELEAAGLVRRHGGDVELVPPEAVKGRPLIRVSRETTERPEAT